MSDINIAVSIIGNIGPSDDKEGKVDVRENIQVDVTGSNFIHQTQAIGGSREALTNLGEIGNGASNLGYIYLRNLSVGFNITIGVDNIYHPILLRPGEFAVLRWNNVLISPWAKSEAAGGTGSVAWLEYLIIED